MGVARPKQAPVAVAALVPAAQANLAACTPVATPTPRPITGTGITSPELLAFRRRVEAVLARVLEHAPTAPVDRLRTPLIACALQDRQLLTVSDADLFTFLHYAAHMGLLIGKELLPVVDTEPGAGALPLAWVASPAGVRRLIAEAGARHIQSGTVYAADTFRCNVGDGVCDFVHEAPKGDADRGPVVAYYALGDFRQGDWAARVLTSVELVQRREASPRASHRIWRDYRDRLGEVQALWDLASLVELGHPQRPGPLYPVSVEPVPARAETPTPAAPAASADLTAQLMALRAARSRLLPGDASVFDGHGGKRLRDVPSGILRGVRLWIAAEPARLKTYRTLTRDITLVLEARRTRAARASASQEPSRA